MTASDGFINHLQLLASCFHNHRCESLIAIPVLLQKEITSRGPGTQPPRYMLRSCLFLYCRERAARPEGGTELVSCYAKQKDPGTGLSSASGVGRSVTQG